MAKTMKKLDSKLQKQQQGWSKISNTARKHDKDENLENYDSEVQMYARARSASTFWAKVGYLKSPDIKSVREVSSEFVKFKTSSTQIFSFLYY